MTKKCWVACHQCSYEEVAKIMCDEIVMNPFLADYCVDDQFVFLRRFRYIRPTCLLVGDSMADPRGVELGRDIPFYVSSRWNLSVWKSAGFPVQGYFPRPVQVYPSLSTKKTRDFIVVGHSHYFDRKNLYLTRQLLPDAVIVGGVDPDSRYYVKDRKLHPFHTLNTEFEAFTFSQRKLHELIASSRFIVSLSTVEGVGLPQIEAMYYGTVPVYTNGHGHAEFLTGLPVKVKDEYALSVGGYNFRVWEPDLEDAKQVLDRARQTRGGEYEELSEKVRRYFLSRYTKVKTREESEIYQDSRT